MLQQRAVHRVGQRDGLHHDGHGAQHADDQSDGRPTRRRPGTRAGQLGVDQAGPAARRGRVERSSEAECRVLHVDGPTDEALGDGEPGGRCIFAGGGRADPIGQVRHDGGADRLEPVVGRRRSR